ncbi:MAG: molecular chaperone DnaJ, partial [Chroococcales cyanobacterium]
EVYVPLNEELSHILSSLNPQLEELAADPFDDELMADFESYLEDCRIHLEQAQQIFASQPNPAKVASVAALLYYCLNHLNDAIEELAWFPLNYDEHYLHRGQELFRIATRLLQEATEAIEFLV